MLMHQNHQPTTTRLPTCASCPSLNSWSLASSRFSYSCTQTNTRGQAPAWSVSAGQMAGRAQVQSRAARWLVHVTAVLHTATPTMRGPLGTHRGQVLQHRLQHGPHSIQRDLGWHPSCRAWRRRQRRGRHACDEGGGGRPTSFISQPRVAGWHRTSPASFARQTSPPPTPTHPPTHAGLEHVVARAHQVLQPVLPLLPCSAVHRRRRVRREAKLRGRRCWRGRRAQRQRRTSRGRDARGRDGGGAWPSRRGGAWPGGGGAQPCSLGLLRLPPGLQRQDAVGHHGPLARVLQVGGRQAHKRLAAAR